MFTKKIDITYESGSMRIYYVLVGDRGATQFAFGIVDTSSKWYELECCHYYPIDLGYHAKERQYENQHSMECCYLGTCYYDGSTLRARDWLTEIFSTPLHNQHEIIWERLEQEYHDRFGEE